MAMVWSSTQGGWTRGGEPQPWGRRGAGDGGDQGEGFVNEMVIILDLQGLQDFIM